MAKNDQKIEKGLTKKNITLEDQNQAVMGYVLIKEAAQDVEYIQF